MHGCVHGRPLDVFLYALMEVYVNQAIERFNWKYVFSFEKFFLPSGTHKFPCILYEPSVEFQCFVDDTTQNDTHLFLSICWYFI